MNKIKNKNDFLLSQLEGEISEKDLKRIYGNVEKNDRFIDYKKVKKALLGNVNYDDLNRPEKELYRVINGDEEKLEEKIDEIKNVIQEYEENFKADAECDSIGDKDSLFINKQKVEDIIKKIEDNTRNYEERKELLKQLEEQVKTFKQKVASIYKTEINSLKKFYSLDIRTFVEQNLEKFNDINHYLTLLTILNERPAISDEVYFFIEKACGQNLEIFSICSKLLQMINERSAVNEMFLPVDKTDKVDKTYQNNLEPITEYPSDEEEENSDVIENIQPIEAKEYEIDESDDEELEKTINLLENNKLSNVDYWRENNGLSNVDYGRFLRNIEDFSEYKYLNMDLEEEYSFAEVINNLKKKEEKPVLDFIIQNNEQLSGKVLEIEKMIDTIKNSKVSYKEKQNLLNDLEKAVGEFKQQVEEAYKKEIRDKAKDLNQTYKDYIEKDLGECISIWDYRRSLNNVKGYVEERQDNSSLNSSNSYHGTNNNNYELLPENPFANNLNDNNNIENIDNNNNDKYTDPDQFQENYNNNIGANNVGNFKKSDNDIFDERYYKCRNDLYDYMYIYYNGDGKNQSLFDEIVENNDKLFSLFLDILKKNDAMRYSGRRSNFLLNKYEKAVNNFKQQVEEAYKKEIMDKAKDLNQTDKDFFELYLGNCASIQGYRKALDDVKKYVVKAQQDNPGNFANNLNDNNNNVESFSNNDNNEFGGFNNLYYNTNNNNYEPLPDNPFANNLNNNNNIDYINNNENKTQQEPEVSMNDNEINTDNANNIYIRKKVLPNNNYNNNIENFNDMNNNKIDGEILTNNNYNNNIENFNNMNNNESNGIYTKKVVSYYKK